MNCGNEIKWRLILAVMNAIICNCVKKPEKNSGLQRLPFITFTCPNTESSGGRRHKVRYANTTRRLNRLSAFSWHPLLSLRAALKNFRNYKGISSKTKRRMFWEIIGGNALLNVCFSTSYSFFFYLIYSYKIRLKLENQTKKKKKERQCRCSLGSLNFLAIRSHRQLAITVEFEAFRLFCKDHYPSLSILHSEWMNLQ